MKSFSRGLVAVLLAAVITGCTAPRIDWNARVGHYTYKQAVADYGPPDRETRLYNGQIVAKWVSRYETDNFGDVGGGFQIRTEETVPSYSETSLDPTFDNQKVLRTWRGQ